MTTQPTPSRWQRIAGVAVALAVVGIAPAPSAAAATLKDPPRYGTLYAWTNENYTGRRIDATMYDACNDFPIRPLHSFHNVSRRYVDIWTGPGCTGSDLTPGPAGIPPNGYAHTAGWGTSFYVYGG